MKARWTRFIWSKKMNKVPLRRNKGALLDEANSRRANKANQGVVNLPHSVIN